MVFLLYNNKWHISVLVITPHVQREWGKVIDVGVHKQWI